MQGLKSTTPVRQQRLGSKGRASTWKQLFASFAVLASAVICTTQAAQPFLFHRHVLSAKSSPAHPLAADIVQDSADPRVRPSIHQVTPSSIQPTDTEKQLQDKEGEDVLSLPGIYNTTIVKPPDGQQYWGAGENIVGMGKSGYDFSGDGKNVLMDKTGSEYPMQRLAQSTGNGLKGKGWKVAEDAPDEVPALYRSLQPLNINDQVNMVIQKGYPSETHECVTRDGFVLKNFRIPYGYNGPNGAKRSGSSGVERQPILLVHGISLSSTSFVVNEKDESLGFVLADAGYDVWMLNTRGNTFSRRNVDFSVDDPRFWAWSFDELALEDLPAVVAYIMSYTGAKKVHLLGHSQGGSMALAALSKLPEMNKAIGLNVVIAPVVYTKYMTAPVLVQFSTRANDSIVYSLLPPQEWIFMSQPVHNLFLDGVCQLPPSLPACLVTTTQMFGTSEHISVLQYRRMWQQWPSPTSYYNVLQWAQMYNAKEPRFMQFNYGPEYDLQEINAPTFFLSGGRDVLAAGPDTQRSRAELNKGGALVGQYEVPSYSHMDFIWHTKAKLYFYVPLLDAVNKFT